VLLHATEAEAVDVDGRSLKVWRVSRGLRQFDVAEQLGVDPGRVSDWERGRRRPTAEQAARLAELILEDANATGGTEDPTPCP
jgi:transcriptional regulator with XRE-family HTH domain